MIGGLITAEDDNAGSRGYTPSPIRAKTGAGSSTLPPRPQDVAGANVLLAIVGAGSMAGAAACKKKKEVVQVSGGFSDSVASLGGAPTSPALRRPLRRKRLSLPLPASDADAPTGGSFSATAAASNLALQPAGANVSGTDGAVTLPSVSRQREGKGPAVEMTVSDISLTAPHFVSADFASRLEISPFVESVCQIVSPSGGPSPFTELNEFGEGCAAAESLLIRVRRFPFRLLVLFTSAPTSRL